MTLFSELKRRNVFRVAVAYLVTSWLLIQVAETIFPLYGFGDGPARIVVTLLIIGFIPTLIFSWVFELTAEGLKRDSETAVPESGKSYSAHKLDRGIIVVLATS